MSKIGKLPVSLPEGTQASIEADTLSVKGPKGSLALTLPKNISLEIKDNTVFVSFKEDKTIKDSSIYGTTRSKIANMVKGVSSGWVKEMELVGTGYRAEVSGNILTLTVGYSHPVKITAPEGVSFKVEKSIITIEGPDKEIIGELAAKIRFVRPPEPYKGKGIKYRDEVIRKKAGKAAKVAGAPGAA